MELLVVAAVVLLLIRLLGRRPVASDSTLLGPVGWSPGADWRIVPPLARADLRRVLRHPAFIAASPDGARTLHDITNEGSTEGGALITFPGWDAPPMWGVDYAIADAELALTMLELPDAEVRARLDADWEA